MSPLTTSAAIEAARQFSGVTSKTEFGNTVLLVGDSRFAAVTDRALVVHLPASAQTAALRLGGKPFVSAGAMNRHGWVEIRLANLTAEAAAELLAAAHQSALHARRRSALKKPARARPVRPKRTN